ncbi:6893_t:CDS:2, partial [Scutellospora calospora]
MIEEEPKNSLLQSHKEALEVYVMNLVKEWPLESESKKEEVIITKEEQEKLYNKESQTKNERKNQLDKRYKLNKIKIVDKNLAEEKFRENNKFKFKFKKKKKMSTTEELIREDLLSSTPLFVLPIPCPYNSDQDITTQLFLAHDQMKRAKETRRKADALAHAYYFGARYHLMTTEEKASQRGKYTAYF